MLLIEETHHHSIVRVQNCRIKMVVNKRKRKRPENHEVALLSSEVGSAKGTTGGLTIMILPGINTLRLNSSRIQCD